MKEPISIEIHKEIGHPDLHIHATEEFPVWKGAKETALDYEAIEKVMAMYEKDAKKFVDALQETLPGGLMDRIATLLSETY